MADAALGAAVRTHLTTILTSVDDVEDYLQAAVESVGELLGLEASWTLSTLVYERPITVATTDRAAWEADQVEFDLADGPCVDLLLQETGYDGIDLATEQRWPAWAAMAGLLGFRSAAAVGAAFEPDQRLVLNSYSGQDALLDPAAVDLAQQFVDELAGTMPLALRVSRQAGEISQLQEALASRSTIDQALGVLMAQNRCTRDEAFGILRRASQNRNVKLRDVATAVIERVTGHLAAAPPPFRRDSGHRD